MSSGVVAAWTITDDTVWQNDSNCFISVAPHTLGSSGWSTVTFKAHNYSGNVDVCFGFNTTETVLRSPQWKNHWENTTTYHQAYFYNVTDIQVCPDCECDYGNDYNTYHRTITYHRPIGWDETTNTTSYELTTTNACFDNYDQSETNYTAYWHTDHSTWETWTPIPNNRYHTTTHDFQGFDKWYYATDLTVTAGTEYQCRIWLDIPISLYGSSGKYFFAIKPSSETISQAIDNDHFYYLDPWWNATWDYRKQVNVSHVNASGDTLMNFPAYINVTKEPEMQFDYDDVVFTDTSGDVMAYELENYTTTHGIYWVNITSLPVSGTSFWMYYGNDEATDQSNPTGVWDSDYVMVQHFQDMNDSTSYENDGTNDGSTYNSTWLLDGEREFDGIGDYVACGNNTSLDFDAAGDMTLEAWINFNTLANVDRIVQKKGTGTGYIFRVDVNDRLSAENPNGWGIRTGNTVLSADTWYHTVAVYSNQTIALYLNGWAETLSGTPGTFVSDNTTNVRVSHGGGSAVFNGFIDEVRISRVVRLEDWINESYQLVTNQSTFVIFGEEEPIDTTFTVTLPSGYTHIKFEPTLSTDTNVTPNGQNSTQPFFNVTNTGDVNLDVRLQINATVTNIILKADTDNNPVGSQEVNTTYVTMYSALTPTNSVDIWLWSDFDHAIQQNTNKTIEVNVTTS